MKCEKVKYPKANIISDKIRTEEDTVDIPENRLVYYLRHIESPFPDPFLETRGDGEFKNLGYYLSQSYDWVVVMDKANSIVLLPLKKDC